MSHPCLRLFRVRIKSKHHSMTYKAPMIWALIASSASSTSLPSEHSTAATMASISEQASLVPTSGPLHILAPSLGLLFPQMVAWQGTSHHLKRHLLGEGLLDYPTQAVPGGPLYCPVNFLCNTHHCLELFILFISETCLVHYCIPTASNSAWHVATVQEIFVK